MESADDDTRLVAGAMTGTSIDGIDAALVRIDGYGLEMRAGLVRHVAAGLGPLRDRLRAAANPGGATAEEIAALALDLGELHAEVIARLARPGERIDLVAAHGQTIYHRPPVSTQLLDPEPIAAQLGAPVVFDFRQADLAAGGQGAPITPLADWILFRDPTHRRAVVNLGGFCNVTILPRADSPEASDGIDGIEGFDVCPCNHVLDGIARTALGKPYDENGAAASAGTARPGLVDSLAARLRATASGRSLGTGDEASGWIEEHRGGAGPEDLAASAAHAIGAFIGDRLRTAGVTQAIVAGGGARNRALATALDRSCAADVFGSDTLGVPVEAREAAAMAILGALCADGIPITLPRVTGCRRPAPVAGSWIEAPHSRRPRQNPQ